MIVGLTGGIATGKSLVAGEMKRLGASVVDADQVARDVVEPGMPAFEEIVREFGPGVVGPDKKLDRKKLGAIVFADRAALKRLNSITHPRIRERMKEEAKRLEAGGRGIVVLDIALLIENGVKYDMDRIMVVYADREQQERRLMGRDGLTREEAQNRLACQMDIKEKLGYADFVIDNSGTVERTLEQTRAAYQKLAAETVKKGT